MRFLFGLLTAGLALALTACGGSSGSSSTMPAQANSTRVRFLEGAPALYVTVKGEPPQEVGDPYLRVDGQTIASAFAYGTLTGYVTMPARALSLSVHSAGSHAYVLGPLKSATLAAGHRYTVMLVGSYPKYSVLAFADPPNTGDAQLSLYEGSPTVPQAAFGTFSASTGSNFKERGSAKFGEVATVTLAKSVSNLGGYAGMPAKPLGKLTLEEIDPHDTRNVLPFHVATRLSLFLLDPGTGSESGPVFGSLDQ
jgi:Domain of unknown function (DUF4397)